MYGEMPDPALIVVDVQQAFDDPAWGTRNNPDCERNIQALVEIEAGPFLVTAAVTRDAVEELGLAPGIAATAAVKATSVMVERA